MARARSRGSVNMLVTIDNVAGRTSAPPTPITTRAPISSPGDPAWADSAEASPKDGQPDRQHPSTPEAVGQRARSEQQTSEHHLVGVDEPLQGTVVGVQRRRQRRQCTLRMVTSIVITNRLAHTVTSAAVLRPGLSSGATASAAAGGRAPSTVEAFTALPAN
jgi:hypothetical protein